MKETHTAILGDSLTINHLDPAEWRHEGKIKFGYFHYRISIYPFDKDYRKEEMVLILNHEWFNGWAMPASMYNWKDPCESFKLVVLGNKLKDKS